MANVDLSASTEIAPGFGQYVPPCKERSRVYQLAVEVISYFKPPEKVSLIFKKILQVTGVSKLVAKVSSLYERLIGYRYRRTLSPQDGEWNHQEASYPKLGETTKAHVKLITNSKESHEWKKRLILSADRSIELSPNFAGGEKFQEILTLIEFRMKEKKALQVHILCSKDLLTADDIALLKKLEKTYSSQFHFLISDRIICVGGGEFRAEENHVKLLVIDEKYFFTGGTGVHSKMNRHDPQDKTGREKDKTLGAMSLPAANRDMDVIGRGEIAKTLRVEFFNLYRIWNYRTTGKETPSRYTPVIESQGICDELESDPKFYHDVNFKAFVSGPEHNGNNSISSAFADLIRTAKKTVYLSSLLFMPGKKMGEAMLSKKGEGVKIVASLNGPALRINVIPFRKYYQFCTKVYEYNKPAGIHRKVLVVDKSKLAIGTYNLSTKSEKYDHEIAVVIEDSKIAEEAVKAIKKDIEDSKEYSQKGVLGKVNHIIPDFLGRVR